MPTYDYRCSSCGHVFEEFQSITAEPLKECPKCHRPDLVRIMAGGAGMIFKGSGFYLTDYAKSGTSKSSSSPAKKSDDASSTPSTPSTDTKKP